MHHGKDNKNAFFIENFPKVNMTVSEVCRLMLVTSNASNEINVASFRNSHNNIGQLI